MSEIKFTWDRCATSVLITAYETHPNLYQTNTPIYKLKNKRMESLQAIKEVLFENGFDVPITEINKKIHGLRTQFFKEYGKVKRSYASGSGTDDVHIPTLWCYELLKFLINTDPVRDSESNLQTTEENELDENVTENVTESQHENVILYDGDVTQLVNGITVNPCPNIPQSKKARNNSKNKLEAEATALMKNASSILNNYTTNRSQADDFSAFASLIAAELRKVNDADEVRVAKREILNSALDAQDRAARKKKTSLRQEEY